MAGGKRREAPSALYVFASAFMGMIIALMLAILFLFSLFGRRKP